jgi:hypothetical protein
MKTSSYKSQSILGNLYRRALDFKKQNPNLFEAQDSNDSTNFFTKVNNADNLVNFKN